MLKVHRFLSDNPGPEDQFKGTHKKVAEALGTAITEDNGIQGGAIALMGGWGSGKSTVVKLLERELGGSPYEFFTFDTWAHQGDPIRRSFLEALIAQFKLNEPKKTGPVFQRHIENMRGDRQESKSETRKVFPAWALWVGFIGFIGAEFVKLLVGTLQNETNSFSAGLADTMAGVVAIIALSILAFFAMRTNSKDKGDLADTVLNKGERSITEGVTRHLANTTIEYNRIFDDCAKAICQQRKGNAANAQQLVLVIDNLDRLPKHQATKLWAEMRNFFASEREGERGACLKNVWCIVPIAEENIPELLDQTQEKTEDLIEKTFDLVFRVPPLIFSDWRELFRKATKKIFEDSADEHQVEDCIRLIQAYMEFRKRLGGKCDEKESWKGLNLIPLKLTPRWIKALVNKLATLALQWEESPLPLLCTFELFDVAWPKAYGVERRKLKWPKSLTENLPKDWERGIVGLYYNVAPDKADQVLWGSEVSRELTAGNEKYVTENAERPFFKESVEKVVSSLSPESGENIIRASWALEAMDAKNPLVQHTWEILAQKLATVSKFVLNEEIANELCRAISSFPGDIQRTLLLKLFETLVEMPSIIELPPAEDMASEVETIWMAANDPRLYVVALSRIYHSLKDHMAEMVLIERFEASLIPKFDAGCQHPEYPQAYCEFVAGVLIALQQHEELSVIRFQVQSSKYLPSIFASLFQQLQGNRLQILPQITKRMHLWQWDDYAQFKSGLENAADHFLRKIAWDESNDLEDTKYFLLAAVYLWFEPGTGPAVPKNFSMLGMEGHYLALLGATLDDTDLEARAIFLLVCLKRSSSNDPPADSKIPPGVFQRGKKFFEDFKLSDVPDSELIKEMARWALHFYTLQELCSIAERVPWARALAEEVIAQEVFEPLAAWPEFLGVQHVAEFDPKGARKLLLKMASENCDELTAVLAQHPHVESLSPIIWTIVLKEPLMRDCCVPLIKELLEQRPKEHWQDWLSKPGLSIWQLLEALKAHNTPLKMGKHAALVFGEISSNSGETYDLLKYHLAQLDP